MMFVDIIILPSKWAENWISYWLRTLANVIMLLHRCMFSWMLNLHDCTSAGGCMLNPLDTYSASKEITIVSPISTVGKARLTLTNQPDYVCACIQARHYIVFTQKKRDDVPMLGWCWSTVCAAGPTLARHWHSISCWVPPPFTQTWVIHPVLFHCLSCVFDAGPTLKLHWVNAPCLVEKYYICVPAWPRVLHKKNDILQHHAGRLGNSLAESLVFYLTSIIITQQTREVKPMLF